MHIICNVNTCIHQDPAMFCMCTFSPGGLGASPGGGASPHLLLFLLIELFLLAKMALVGSVMAFFSTQIIMHEYAPSLQFPSVPSDLATNIDNHRFKVSKDRQHGKRSRISSTFLVCPRQQALQRHLLLPSLAN
jgi:hypothetical protein